MEPPAHEPWVKAWKPRVPGIREVLHARFTDHVYPPHTHDTWTLFIVDDGAVRYDLDRHARGADLRMVSVLPPRVVHDGRPGSSRGYRKRVLYVELDVLPERLIGAAVDRPAIVDRSLRGLVAALHGTLGCRDDALESETRFALLAEQIRTWLGEPTPESARGRELEGADALRAYLDAHVFEPVTLAGAAEHLGGSPTQLARAFASVFGIPPHAYVIGRRLDAARDRILRGQPLADVAAEVGFFDQAHLTRRFKGFLGTTPRRFRARQVVEVGARE